MWLKNSTRVRGVTPAHTASTTCSADSTGSGTGWLTYLAPRFPHANRHVRSSAPYS